MKYSRFEDLPVWKAAARLFVNIDTLCDDTEINRRGDLADQLHRATLSISNNLAEGFEEGTTQQLLTYVYHAKGSAGEVRSMLQVMLGTPRFTHLKSQVSSLRSQAESISRQLAGFADALQNSEHEGHRYLTEAEREAAQKRIRVQALNDKIAGIMAEVLAKQTADRDLPAQEPLSDASAAKASAGIT